MENEDKEPLMGDQPKMEPIDNKADSSDSDDEATSCCCCVPIEPGITTINIVSIIEVTLLVGITIPLFWDEFIHWWYPLVNLILILGFGLTVVVFALRQVCGKDSAESRANAAIGQILVMVLWAVLSIWSIVYFYSFVKGKQVNLGYTWGMDDNKDESYITMDKKNIILALFCGMVSFVATHFYFYWVTSGYAEQQKEKDE